MLLFEHRTLSYDLSYFFLIFQDRSMVILISILELWLELSLVFNGLDDIIWHGASALLTQIVLQHWLSIWYRIFTIQFGVLLQHWFRFWRFVVVLLHLIIIKGCATLVFKEWLLVHKTPELLPVDRWNLVTSLSEFELLTEHALVHSLVHRRVAFNRFLKWIYWIKWNNIDH